MSNIRTKDIFKNIELENLPFKLTEENYLEFSSDIATNLQSIISNFSQSEGLSWCISTIKKAKVFILIYLANVRGKEIYKEEIAKKLTEYSYKTIATIVDEGIEKGYYVSLDPHTKKITDGKIKNIRPSKEVSIDFVNWNINRIVEGYKLINKHKK